MRKLSTALKHTQLEVERRSVAQQRNYEHKINHVLKQLGNESGSANSSAERKLRLLHDEFSHRDNRELRKHLRGLLSPKPTGGSSAPDAADESGGAGAGASVACSPLVVAAAGDRRHRPAVEPASSVCSSRTPSLLGLHAVQALHQKITGLHRLRGRQTAPATTTTVTREKNKLIIKQQPVHNEPRDREKEGGGGGSSSKRRMR